METPTIFISYDPNDSMNCERYSRALLAQGFDIWFAQVDLINNNPLSVLAEREMETRSAFILLLSPSSINSIPVGLQLEAYRNFMRQDPSKIILLVQIAPCKIPPLLQEYKSIDGVHLSFEDTVTILSSELHGIHTSTGLLSSRASRRVIINKITIAVVGLTLISGSGAFAWWHKYKSVPAINYKRVVLGTHLLTYRGHTDTVYAVSWSNNGQSIASGSADFFVDVWDATTGQLSASYLHDNTVYSIAWSPNNEYLAVVGESKFVRVWNTVTKNLFYVYSGHTDWIFRVRWSPDGKYVASAGKDHTVQISGISNKSYVLTYRGHLDIVLGVAWSPDGKYVASASKDHTVHVWNATNGQLLFIYRGHTDAVTSVAWSYDGACLSSASTDRSVKMWDARSGKNLRTFLGHSDTVYGVTWSPDRKRIASCSFDKTVRIWDITTGKHVFTYQGHSNSVYEVAWSPDGTRIASCSDDKTIQIWQAR